MRKRTTVELLTGRLTRDLTLSGPTAADHDLVPAGTLVLVEDVDAYFRDARVSSSIGIWVPCQQALRLVCVERGAIEPLKAHLHTGFALNREDVSFALTNPR